jgi:hypothetical protein
MDFSQKKAQQRDFGLPFSGIYARTNQTIRGGRTIKTTG